MFSHSVLTTFSIRKRLKLIIKLLTFHTKALREGGYPSEASQLEIHTRKDIKVKQNKTGRNYCRNYNHCDLQQYEVRIC